MFWAWLFWASVVAAEPQTESASPSASETEARQLIHAALRAHGLERDRRLELQFEFRGTPYRIRLDGDDVRYERNEAGHTHRLVGEQLEVVVKGRSVHVEPGLRDALRRSLNSVGYFATLPRPLLDDAVMASSLGRQSFDGSEWDIVEVRFRKEGGGDDHDDVFRYWFHPETHEMGFVAYRFHVNAGGVRIRQAIGRHERDGVVLIDWANHGWDGEHTLDEAIAAFEKGELPKLSTIALTQVKAHRLLD